MSSRHRSRIGRSDWPKLLIDVSSGLRRDATLDQVLAIRPQAPIEAAYLTTERSLHPLLAEALARRGIASLLFAPGSSM